MYASLKSLSQVPFETFLDTFNAVYLDYFVPLQMTRVGMQRVIERDAIDLEKSRAAYVDAAMVGVGLLALRQQRAWIGGMGVRPLHRRHGVGRQLMEALLTSAQGIAQVDLEVIEQNEAAKQLYLSLGFTVQRHLYIVERDPQAIPPAQGVSPISAAKALADYEALHAVPNPWQRDLASLRHLVTSLQGWAVFQMGDLVAYALGWVLPETIRFMDVGLKAGHEDALTNILAHVHHLQPKATGSFINLPADDPAWPVFEAMGYAVTVTQHEMRLRPL